VVVSERLLMPLEIRGLGTVEVESLNSYLYRLAYFHGVTVSELLEQVKNWYKKRLPLSDEWISRAGSGGGVEVYVRPNNGTRNVVKIITEATGVDGLEATTLLSFSEVFPHPFRFFSCQIKWCPFCMREESMKGIGYFKLIWMITGADYCNIHNVKLISTCSKCGKRISGYGYIGKLYVCRNCGSDLFDIPITETTYIESWDAESDMHNTIRYLSDNPAFVFKLDDYHKSLKYFNDLGCFSRASGLYDHTIKYIRQKNVFDIEAKILRRNYNKSLKYTPSLLEARRLAAIQKVDLLDLLLGNTDQFVSLDQSHYELNILNEFLPYKKKSNLKYNEMLDRLHDLMKQYKDTPKPLKFYAESLGVSSSCLKHRYKTLSQRILRTYKLWKEQDALDKRVQVQKEIINYMQLNPSVLSKQKIVNDLLKRKEFPKYMFREEVDKIFDTMMSKSSD